MHQVQVHISVMSNAVDVLSLTVEPRWQIAMIIVSMTIALLSIDALDVRLQKT